MGQLAFFWKDFVAILWRVQCTLDVQTLDRQGHEGHGALMVNDVGVDRNFATPVIDRVAGSVGNVCICGFRHLEGLNKLVLDPLEHRMLGILGDCWAPGRPMEIFNPATDGAVVLFARLGIRL